MEAEKLQKLHETLSKLVPRGKVGGLGYNSFVKQSKPRNDVLPNNGINLYFDIPPTLFQLIIDLL